MRRQVRQKKWIGGLLMGLLSLAGGALSYFGNKKSNETQIDLAKQQAAQEKLNANQQATNQKLQQLNSSFNNTDYLNSYYDRFNNNVNGNSINTSYSLRCGGKKKVKRCGGRSKAELGKFASFMKTNGDTVGNIAGSLGNLIFSGLSMENNIKTSKELNNIYRDLANYKPNTFTYQGYTGDTYRNDNNGFRDRFQTLKCGGKRKA